MTNYFRLYRFGITPWERYGQAAAASIAAALDREETERHRPLGRALLQATDCGRFDFFLDIGCFQGLDAGQRLAEGHGVSQLANPGATLLMLAFGPTRLRSLIGGVSRAEVEAGFPDWELPPLSVACGSGEASGRSG